MLDTRFHPHYTKVNSGKLFRTTPRLRFGRHKPKNFLHALKCLENRKTTPLKGLLTTPRVSFVAQPRSL